MQVVDAVRRALLGIDTTAGIVCAVSGGGDSVALLHVLWSLRAPVKAFHLNHQLRAEADGDAEFVRALCERLGVECVVETERIPQKGKEAAGREARYRHLARLGTLAVTGHTMDDQAETVLLRLLRGAGAKGLSGIQPIRRFDMLTVVRPLLQVRRAELRGYLLAQGIEFREDATNQDRQVPRNRIRHELLPMLAQQYNPRIVEALARTAEALREDEAYLQAASRDKAGLPPVAVETLATLHPALLRRVVAEAAPQAEWHHRVAVQVALQQAGQAEISLPGDRQGTTRSGFMVVGQPETPEEAPDPVRVRLPGTSVLPGWGLRLQAVAVAQAERRGPQVAYLDAERTGNELLVRSRQPGDRIWPVGMQGRQKLKQVFIDAKVPRARRPRIPVLATPAGDVVWVPGLRLDRRFAADAGSTSILRVEVKEEPCSSL